MNRMNCNRISRIKIWERNVLNRLGDLNRIYRIGTGWIGLGQDGQDGNRIFKMKSSMDMFGMYVYLKTFR